MDPKLDKIMDVFRNHFAPAENLEESDEQMTTQEIFDKIEDLLKDEEITISSIHEALIESGYIYDYVMDSFKWLLRYKGH